MTIKFIKVTKKDRTCYAPVPEPVEQGDNLEIMEVKDGALSPRPTGASVVSLSRNPMVFVKVNDGFKRILMKHILYVEAGGSYCTLHVHGMPSILVSAPLARVAEHLDGEYFLRVHRSYLVNKLHIESIAGNFLQVGNVSIPVSKFMKKKVLGGLNMLSFSK
ncbi:LytTR family DNA-binding domain-containing protein [uncultured Akkermansia sp.]|uniref:LytR/AlgR family response regulator transcription factor n=1 Tax=uncultured Akkermansia sp. TaxID=512294 RepID=UPI00265CEF4E|nr:LytTR family DNA-binding domain-containing protein [uncultured Akkermansia sp.]